MQANLGETVTLAPFLVMAHICISNYFASKIGPIVADLGEFLFRILFVFQAAAAAHLNS